MWHSRVYCFFDIGLHCYLIFFQNLSIFGKKLISIDRQVKTGEWGEFSDH